VKVVVAGAGGVLGRHLLPLLIGAGHEVVGTSRSLERLVDIGSVGAEAVKLDALDRDSVIAAVTAARPDAIIHALTALPPDGPTKVTDLDATNRLRIDGTANLLAAARQAAVERFVAESLIGVYGRAADGLLTEDAPLADVPAAGAGVVGALRSLEEQVLGSGGMALRFGFFYGPDVPSTQAAVARLRRRLLPMPGGAPGVASYVHVEDAASGIVAALERGHGGEAYNIVDDEPVTFGEFFRRLAVAAGAPAPVNIPVWLGRLVAPYATALAVDAQLPASNHKARSELGWQPAFATVREGSAAFAR
jgi:nucleoside-diphosphate-sugar epimerase